MPSLLSHLQFPENPTILFLALHCSSSPAHIKQSSGNDLQMLPNILQDVPPVLCCCVEQKNLNILFPLSKLPLVYQAISLIMYLHPAAAIQCRLFLHTFSL